LHELTAEEAGKMRETLIADRDIAWYFNAKDGLKILVSSLRFNTHALEIIQRVLDADVKLQEDFQKQHLYERLIEFLHKSN
jgi:hypothetical protein